MIDQLFMKDLARDIAPPLEPVEQPATLLAAGPATSDVGQVTVQGYKPGQDTAGGAFVGTRLNTPKAGQAQPTQQDREKLAIGLLDSLAGALRGAVAQTIGLPGDIRSIVDLISKEGADKYLGQAVMPTTEEMLAGTALPPVLGEGATNIAERQPTVETAEQVGTFLPAPGIPEAAVKGAKLLTKAVKATKGLPVGNSIKDVTGAEVLIPKAPKVETKAFKNWFGDSKIVDESNKPLVVYHGTASNFDEFRPGFSGSSENETTKLGFWFTDNPKTAEDFSKRTSDEYVTKIDPNTGDVMRWEDGQPKEFRAPDTTGSIMPVYLSIKKPLVFETKGDVDAFEAFMDFRDKWAEYINGTKGVEGAWRKRYVALNVDKTNKEFLDYLHNNGYDGVVLKNTMYDAIDDKPITQYLVTDPVKIKSAIGNKGTFDPNNPSILYGAGAGAVATQQEEVKAEPKKEQRIRYDASGRRVQ